MVREKPAVGAVGGVALAVVVQRVDLLVRERDAADALAPAVVTILVLVDVVAEVEDLEILLATLTVDGAKTKESLERIRENIAQNRTSLDQISDLRARALSSGYPKLLQSS